MRRLSGGGKLTPPAGAYEVFRGFIGGTLGILLVASLAMWSGTPWIIAPFGATCVLLFALPRSPLAQPRNVVFGHLVSALSGLVFINLIGDSTISMALSVGCAIAAMQVLRITHAPAGANPLVIFMAGIHNWDFLIAPVLIGAVTLVVVALVLNNLRSGDKYPSYWIGSCPTKPSTVEQRKAQGG